MISIRLVPMAVFVVVLCCRAMADEVDVVEIESPSRDAAYLSTSDIVLAGRSKSFGLKASVKILSAKGTAVHAKASFRTGVRETNGSWVCWIASPEHRGWRPGARRAQIAIEGRAVEIPITIVPDLIGDGVPIAVPTTGVDSNEYSKLPRIKLEAVTLSDLEMNPSKLIPDAKPGKNGIIVDGTDEFAVEGTLRFQEPKAFRPPEIIFRLTESQAGDGITAKTKVIAGESLAVSEPTNDRAVFRYRTVLRAPNRPGILTLEVIYRRRIIAASLVEVRPAEADDARTGWVVEYPPPNSTYSTISDIVVAGRGRPAPMPIAVEMHDANDVIHQSAVATAGGPTQDGAWSVRLPLPRPSVWRFGQYQIEVCPVYGRQIAFPIRVVAGRVVPEALPEKPTRIESEDYDALPCLKLTEAILSIPDITNPKVTIGIGTGDSVFRIQAGDEFSCESTLTFQDEGEYSPFDVILRLTETTVRDGQKPGDPNVTVGEAIAKYNTAEPGRKFPFRSVLRAPNLPGKLKVDAFYRKAVIASTTIDVVPRAEK